MAKKPNRPTPRTGGPVARQSTAAYSALIGLCSLAIFLQAVWAGVFLRHDGQRDSSEVWINVHAGGAYAALLLAIAAAVVAFVSMRARRDLLLGTIALAVLLLVELGLGQAIADHGADDLTAVHIPLAMALMGLAVWLPLRARHRG